MASGDFLLVAPPEWWSLPNAASYLVNWGIEGIRLDIDQQAWGSIDGLVEAEGLLPAGTTVGEARLIDAGSEPQLWLRFIPNPPSP